MSLEIAKKFMVETRMADPSLYADDFVTTFPDGSQMPRAAILSAVQAIVAAAPDFSFNTTDWSEKDGKVTATAKVTATMTKSLSHPQFGEIPATGKLAILPSEHFTITFRDGKVTSMVVASSAPGGPPEVIRQWTA
jgi:ketosteroid isomerase-like protein